jgi:hypothetical protein
MQGCAVPEMVPVPRCDAVHADSAKTMAASDRRTGAVTPTILLMVVGRYDGRNRFSDARTDHPEVPIHARAMIQAHTGDVPISGIDVYLVPVEAMICAETRRD